MSFEENSNLTLESIINRLENYAIELVDLSLLPSCQKKLIIIYSQKILDLISFLKNQQNLK
jgi:hypothetical protein